METNTSGNSKSVWYVIVAIVVILVIVWAVLGNKKQTPGEPIRIGATISQTGYAAAFGENSLKAMNLAVDEINEKGGINNRKVELVVEDDHTDSKTAVTAFDKLTDIDKVDAVIGGLWDFTAQPIFPIADEKQITFISPSNFRIAGSFEPGKQSFVLLTEFDKTLKTLTNYIKDIGAERMAVVRFSSAFGEQIKKSISEIMTGLGKPDILDEKYAAIGGNDFATTVLKLKQAKIDTVFLDMLDSDSNNFLKRANEQSFKPRVIGYTLIKDLMANKEVDRSLLEGIVVLDWEVSGPEFNKIFQDKYGVLPEKSASKSYDAVYILAEAVANSKTKADVANYIETHKFKTVNGEIEFTPEHSVTNTEVKIEVIKNGALEEVKL